MQPKRLYTKADEATLHAELFAAPGREYRAAPFWAWNCAVDKAAIREQLAIFKQMGMGGVHLHVRTGMETPYLGSEFMELAHYAVQEAKRQGLLLWLYDEDRWPSGTAGGQVTAGGQYAARYLLLTTVPYGEYRGKLDWKPDERHGNDFARAENGELLAVLDVALNADGTLRCAARAKVEVPVAAGATRWYVYQERGIPSAWMNGSPYVDTLDRRAIERFRDIGYQPYRDALGDEFGKTIPAIFTDEPQLAAMKCTLKTSFDTEDIFLPWTDGLPAYMEQQYGVDILSSLPELLWELPEGAVSRTRWCYHDAVAELFTSAFCDTLGDWCRDNGLMFTGHLFWEPTLGSQTTKLGEAMRCYRAFDSLPGIDMLCDEHEYNTAKQCQSALRQQGGEGMACELYGATGWAYDLRHHKLHGDWQAALGVTVRVPHLAWMSMRGEAKRDYPASIFYQSPWHVRYGAVEDHFARLNTALTRGVPVVDLAVIHPIESYWLRYGPVSQTHEARRQMDEDFAALTETLLFGLVDFDFISEARLPQLCPEGGFPLRVGQMQYRTVLVPGCLTLRGTTLARLDAFEKAGGRVIFLGECPGWVDAMPSDAVRPLYGRAQRVLHTGLVDALAAERFMDAVLVRQGNTMMRPRLTLPVEGSRPDWLVYQLRRDGKALWLFVANGKNPEVDTADPESELEFTLKGRWHATLYDTLSGDITPLKISWAGESTCFQRVWHLHDSLLLKLEPAATGAKAPGEARPAPQGKATPLAVPPLVDYRLDEPNALLLDIAQTGAEEGVFAEDILRLDNLIRAAAGMPPRKKIVMQPYALPDRGDGRDVRLVLQIDAELEVAGAKLALELPGEMAITLNGEPVQVAPDGWYVDKAIQTVPLPALRWGKNTLEVTQRIDLRAGLEYMYLLGDFGVRVDGSVKTLVPRREKLAFGSITGQGLPFYTGAVEYRLEVDTTGGDVEIRVPHYSGGLVEVLVDGQRAGDIIFSPYRLRVPNVPPGLHEVSLKLYGNRFNGFGQLHFTPGVPYYPAPDSWRSTGDLWMDEYQFKPLGILGAPQVGILRPAQ